MVPLVLHGRLPSPQRFSSFLRTVYSSSSSSSPCLVTSLRFATLTSYYKQKQQYLEDMNSEIDFSNHSWDTGQNYCLLCNEPFETYNNHRGKREHMTIELFFEIICEYARDWQPKKVLEDAFFQSHRGERACRSTSLATRREQERIQRRTISSGQQKQGNSDDDHPAFVPFQSLLNFFESDQKERRNRTHALAKHFVERGALFLGPKQWQHESLSELNMQRMGELVLFEWVHPPIQRLMPHAIAGQISAFSQQCTGYYNLGSAFDFLGFADLIDPRDLPNYVDTSWSSSSSSRCSSSSVTVKPYDTVSSMSLGIGDVMSSTTERKNNNNNSNHLLPIDRGVDFSLSSSKSSSASTSSSFDSSLFSTTTTSPFSSQIEMQYWHKGVVVRNILGQLRWSLDASPINNNNKIGGPLYEFEPHMAVLGEELVHGIIQEVVFLRLAEYITRAEYAWKKIGCPVYDNNRFMELYKQCQAKIGHETQKLNELQRLKRQADKSVLKTNDPMYSTKMSMMKKGERGEGGKERLGAAASDSRPKITKRIPAFHSSSSSPSTPVTVSFDEFEISDVFLADPSLDSSSSSSSSIFDRCSNIRKTTAVERALDIIQGSCHDGVAAILGETKGMSDFASGGSAWNKLSATSSTLHFDDHFDDGGGLRSAGTNTSTTRRWSKGEFCRNETVKELSFIAGQQKRLEENFRHRLKMIEMAKNVESESSSPHSDSMTATHVKSSLPPKPAYPRKPGASLTVTAERLLSEAACGTKFNEARMHSSSSISEKK